MRGFKVLSYAIPQGSVGAYYPETNPLLPLKFPRREKQDPRGEINPGPGQASMIDRRRSHSTQEKAMLSRRDVLATAVAGAAMSTTAAAAASFGNPDEPPQGAINAKNPASVTDPG